MKTQIQELISMYEKKVISIQKEFKAKSNMMSTMEWASAGHSKNDMETLLKEIIEDLKKML